MNIDLSSLVFVAGLAQLSVLVASALVPFRLNWNVELAGLPRLHRQLYFVYGGYVVLSIVSLGAISMRYASELASAAGVARGICIYAALFWGIRLVLQCLLDARPFLTRWWLRCGYHLLTSLFAMFTALFGYLALHGSGT
jgi:hypothetical protein